MIGWRLFHSWICVLIMQWWTQLERCPLPLFTVSSLRMPVDHLDGLHPNQVVETTAKMWCINCLIRFSIRLVAASEVIEEVC